MKYSELVDSGATPTEIQAFLVGSENVPVTMRIPQNLRDAAKEAAELKGLSLTAYVKMCLIERLSEGNQA
jgi:predicted DNA binding CopG/RHH family protein